MAERPDLEYWVPILGRELVGRTIEGALLGKPVVLRQAVEGTLGEVLSGATIWQVERHGRFVRFGLTGKSLDVVFSPMLAGRFEVCEAGSKARKDLAFTLSLDDGRELRYRDSVQMGKVYVIPSGEFSHVPGYEAVGLDVLDARAFTKKRFLALAAKRKDQVRVFLMDKSALDFLGNAYADEVLFAAGIHPKTWVRKLGEEDLVRLFEAVRDVTAEATVTIRKAKPQLDVKLRDFLKVRGRHKEPCPSCGTPIRKAGVRGFDSYFCPSCQPETRKTSIVNWRKAGK